MQLIVHLIGLFASDILSTFVKPTHFVLVYHHCTSKCWKPNLLLSLMQLIVDTGLFASDILSTFVKPTIAFVIPLTVPVMLVKLN
jgi:hypothetical protein